MGIWGKNVTLVLQVMISASGFESHGSSVVYLLSNALFHSATPFFSGPWTGSTSLFTYFLGFYPHFLPISMEYWDTDSPIQSFIPDISLLFSLLYPTHLLSNKLSSFVLFASPLLFFFFPKYSLPVLLFLTSFHWTEVYLRCDARWKNYSMGLKSLWFSAKDQYIIIWSWNRLLPLPFLSFLCL